MKENHLKIIQVVNDSQQKLVLLFIYFVEYFEKYNITV